MSRTLKDAPYRVRARRHGRKVTSHLPTCGHTSTYAERFTAVFYAHETRELEAFRSFAQAHGYEVTTREREGFLAQRGADELDRIQRAPLVRANGGLLAYAMRSVSDRPAPSRRRMLLNMSEPRHKRNIFVMAEAEKLHHTEGRCWHSQHELGPGFQHAGRMRSRRR